MKRFEAVGVEKALSWMVRGESPGGEKAVRVGDWPGTGTRLLNGRCLVYCFSCRDGTIVISGHDRKDFLHCLSLSLLDLQTV